MKVTSLNVGLPQKVYWKDRWVTTGIFKRPTDGPLWVRPLNIDGDQQADLRVHGGLNKAVYAYATEHYAYWQKQLPTFDLPFGAFGENLTISGEFYEKEIHVGDRFRVGTAELMAVQPRMPCYKLGLRFGTDDIIRKFWLAARPGVYFRVIREGWVAPGDEVERLSNNEKEVTLLDIIRLFTEEKENQELLSRACQAEALPEELRHLFTARLSHR
jgi:MOSC domain-containing protein YiiM